MLSPHDRSSLFAALRPPEGYQLDAAVGTSFTLDLEAMLTAPISSALYEATQADSDDAEVEPVGLLEAIRRYAERITLFCQAGQIAVPRRRRPVFAWLEDGVIEVDAPRPGRLFHPKVWAVRFSSDEASVLRVLCATRNLTFDTSWDTLLRLETEPYTRADGEPIAGQTGLADLLRRLPALAHHPVADDRREQLDALIDDVERVPLVPPEPFTSVALHTFGLDQQRPSPFPDRSNVAMVVSPFLGEPLLERLLADHPLTALISREESLDRVDPGILRQIERLSVLSSAVEIEPPELDAGPVGDLDQEPAPAGHTAAEHADPGRQLSGLHAKLFVFDTDDGTRLFTGSANATTAAFDGNVEVLAELHGPAAVGVASLLEDSPGESSFIDLLVDYEAGDEPTEPDEAEELEWRLDQLRLDLAAARFGARVREAEEDDYLLELTSDELLPTIDAEVEISVWPITLNEASSAMPLPPDAAPEASFIVTLDGISAFFAFRVTAKREKARASTTFLVKARLEGAPEDRHSRLLASMLRDRDRLLRYLLMLLHDDTAMLVGDGLGQGKGWIGRWLSAGSGEPPLLEVLLRALDRNPDRLDHIDRLLHDLGDEQDELLPVGFSEVWAPIWRHRQGSKR